MRNAILGLLCGLLGGPTLAAHAPHSQPEVRVAILLFDGVQIIDFAGPYEVFGSAGFGVVTLSADGKPVTTAMGLSVTPDHGFADAPPFDVLLVPGGDVGEAEKDPQILAFIREHAPRSRHVLSVCTGSFILGGAGVLDGLEATTFTPRLEQFAERYPEITVVRDVRWTDNGRIITSAGLSSGLDAALHLVARVRGTERAQSVAMRLEYDWKPDGGFVRSRMADRHLPTTLNTSVAWPEGLDMRQEVSFGDEQQWLMRFHVVSASPVDDLLQRIAVGIDAAPGWSREGDSHRWRRSQDGRLVALSLQAEPGQLQDYRWELRLDTQAE